MNPICNARKRAGRRHFHVCYKPKGHKGKHECGTCRHEWEAGTLVRPTGLATTHLSERDGPYRMVFKNSWAYFYKGNKRVWDCNEIFARKHFYEI